MSNLHESPSKTELRLVGDEVGRSEGACDKVGWGVGFEVMGATLGDIDKVG